MTAHTAVTGDGILVPPGIPCHCQHPTTSSPDISARRYRGQPCVKAARGRGKPLSFLPGSAAGLPFPTRPCQLCPTSPWHHRRAGARGAELGLSRVPGACAGSGGCGGARCAFTWRCPCGVGGGPRRPGRGCRATCASTPSAEGERAFQAAAWLLPSRQRGSALPRQWGPSYSSSSLLFSCQP